MLLVSVLTIPAHSFAQSAPVTETGCQEGISRAIVNVSAAYLRLEPDYESPLETQELMGMVVTVLERQRYWVKVETDQPYTAWVNEKALHFVDEQQLADYIAEDKYVTVASWTKVMDAPRKGSAVCDLVWGDELRLGHEKPKAGCLHVLLPFFFICSRRRSCRISPAPLSPKAPAPYPDFSLPPDRCGAANPCR